MADKLKLLFAVLVFAAGIGGFYYLSDLADVIRVLLILGSAGVAIAVAYTTEPGRATWGFGREALVELRKVVWPNRKETMQMTLVVFAMVVLIALFLWVVDWGLLKIIGALTRPGA